ncbi:hypothetical protein [Tsukamurella asaccharolytica]|uniref:hypothetical protein n=1 Tax=Tsukamurella asaccharolytica TaxID=2592067 RepID=UPI001E64EAE0|nr:hypothetical protein [Tsukamurella asaccharolytica]
MPAVPGAYADALFGRAQPARVKGRAAGEARVQIADEGRVRGARRLVEDGSGDVAQVLEQSEVGPGSDAVGAARSQEVLGIETARRQPVEDLAGGVHDAREVGDGDRGHLDSSL